MYFSNILFIFDSMKKLLLINILFFVYCSTNVPEPEPVVIDIPAYGHETTFELATWNVENFPKNNKTLDLVKVIINDIDIDLIAVQEIASVSVFNQLLDSLPGWKGDLSSDKYRDGSYQKTGILYKSEFISVSSLKNIFADDTSDAFPRPPLSAFVEVKDLDSTKYSFNIIILHLKASGFGDEQDNIRRRKEACIKLESYISQEIQSGADADFIVLGDWNDELDDDVNDNVFLPFLNQSNLYSFLTLGVTDASYPSYNSLIDHILITKDSFKEYNGGEIKVLKLDKDIYSYDQDISDHRPVAARFNGFLLNLPE